MIDDLQIREELAKQAGTGGDGSERSYMRRRIFWTAYTWDKYVVREA